MKKIELKVLSADKKHNLSGIVIFPSSVPKGFFHVVHGMAEHIERYEKFMTEMAENGYICFGYNHIGHGNTAIDKSELGFFADKDGWNIILQDVKTFSEYVKYCYYNNKFDEYLYFGEKRSETEEIIGTNSVKKQIPYILMGHSMGSFVVRLASERYVNPDKLILMGTGGKNIMANPGLMIISIVKALRGKKHISTLINNMAFGAFNKKFVGRGDTFGDKDADLWLTNDVEQRKKYYEDEYCGFKFTVSAMGDLIRLIKYSNQRKWFRNFPVSLPVLIVSGKDDPVGNYGKGVSEVNEKLKKQGVQSSLILYSHARHEILNDFTYEKVTEDILAFCKK